MSACEPLVANASAGVAPALRAVDCMANETTSVAFGRLFGTQGALLPALTILLTLYIAFFAFSLLTGRSRLSISALSPRMMTLGMVLTLATSWVAYQNVVWNLAVGGPDEIAGVLMGTQGSATQMFADRIDIVFAAIAEIGSAGANNGQAVAAASAGSVNPGSLMWLSALLLMLGTVGVLVTARIALAVLLATGPVFVVMALFGGTRGLFAGWVRGVVMTGVTPLFTVLGGSFMLELAVPIISALRSADGQVDGRAAMAFFLIAAVHVALIGMMLKVCGTMVSSWTIFGMASEPRSRSGRDGAAAGAPQTSSAPAMFEQLGAQQAQQGRRGSVIAPVAASSAPQAALAAPGASNVYRSTVTNGVDHPVQRLAPYTQSRARGVGSRFRAPSSTSKRIVK